MAKRQSKADEFKINSDVNEGGSKDSKTKVEYYKKVEKTMTRTIIKEGDKNPSTKVVSTTIIKKGDNPEQISKKVYSSKNYGNTNINEKNSSRRFESTVNSKNSTQQQISKKITTSTNSKYTGLQPSSQTIKYSGNNNRGTQQKTTQTIISSSTSKNNTYLANKGNININKKYEPAKGSRSYSSQQKEKYSFAGKKEPVKQEIKETKIYKSQSNPKSKPIYQPILRTERTTIRIVIKKKERTGRKVENFEYLESKDIKNQNKDSTVVHKTGDPFYQIIGEGNKKYSSNTSLAREHKSNYSLNKKDYGAGVKTLESDKNKKYGTNTENKKTTIDTSKYRSVSTTNKYKTKTQTVSSAKANQSKPRDNKYETQKRQNQTIQPPKENKKILPSSKKYQEKTEETYKKGKIQFNQNKKEYDTEKYKKEIQDPNKNKAKTEESKDKQGESNQKEINAQKEPEISGQCPIHGNQGEQDKFGKEGGYIQEQVNDFQEEYGDDADNYRFYESKNVTRKVEYTNTVNSQNIINTENNMNMASQEYISDAGNAQLVGVPSAYGMQEAQLSGIQSSSAAQGLRASGAQEYDNSKIFIASRVVPVYSEYADQQLLSHVCNVCGNPLEQDQIINAQQMSYNNCPIHGQTLMEQQQYSGY